MVNESVMKMTAPEAEEVDVYSDAVAGTVSGVVEEAV
jgi:hypothetical protein